MDMPPNEIDRIRERLQNDEQWNADSEGSATDTVSAGNSAHAGRFVGSGERTGLWVNLEGSKH